MRDRVIKVVKINAILLLVAAVLLTLEMTGNLRTVCPSYTFFHVYCSGCGMTRLCRAVLKLRFYQAFRYNPLAFILLPIFAVMYVVETIKYLRLGRFSRNLNSILIFIGVIIVIYGIIRNIPVLSFLAPTEI